MTAHCRAPLLALLAATALSCRDRAGAGPGVDSPEARRLDGAWTIELHAERMRFEPVTAGAHAGGVVRGEVALVANHWLNGGEDLPRPTQYGSYDIDFRTFGFEPRSPGRLPRAEAGLRPGDSVDIVFEPDDPHESVHLKGVWKSDSIVGAWDLEPARVGGDAAGSFVMARGPSR